MSKLVKEKDIQNKFWETKFPKQIPKITCQEIIKDKGWVLSNVFTKEECQKFIDFGNQIGYLIKQKIFQRKILCFTRAVLKQN